MTCLSKHTNHEETESSQACHCRGTIPIRLLAFSPSKSYYKIRSQSHVAEIHFILEAHVSIFKAFICTLAVLWNQSAVLNFKYQVLGWQQWCFFQNVSFRNYSKLVSGVFWLVINTVYSSVNLQYAEWKISAKITLAPLQKLLLQSA